MAVGLNAVLDAVRIAAERVHRDPAEVRVVVVSKEADDRQVLDAYAAGVRDFGENRADAAEARRAMLPDDAALHFVGRLQTNKARRVRPVTTLLHSLDRPSLAEAWLKGPGRPPPVLVQVNVSGEQAKAGVAPDAARALVDSATDLGLEVVGLMTMAPLASESEASRPWFAALRRLRDEIQQSHPRVTELSMGMTNDYTVAVEEGATILRVGRAIFDPSHEER